MAPMLLQSKDEANLDRCEKTDSEEPNIKSLNPHKRVIKILVSISFAMLVIIGIIVLISHYTNCEINSNSDYTTTEHGDNNNNLGNHLVLDREQWDGRPPISIVNNKPPIGMVVIKHTGGGFCNTFQSCRGKVQTIQSQNAVEYLSDIRFNFLIGGDGNIYVGRGWDVQNADRNNTIDIAFLGSYSFDKLTADMIEATKLLLEDGVRKQKLEKDYKLVSHNQTRATDSPGTNVYKEIINWTHYDGGMY